MYLEQPKISSNVSSSLLLETIEKGQVVMCEGSDWRRDSHQLQFASLK
jgi:hypothetical protein